MSREQITNELLTIVLPIRDRLQFTSRWMRYMNGGKDPECEKLLSDLKNFPQVCYEYIRYPYDSSYGHYYEKVADAIARVKTPYVVMADDDDFFLIEGLHRAILFLEKNKCFVGYAGQTGLVYSKNQIHFKKNAIFNIDSESPLIRLTHHFKYFSLNFYNVYQLEILKKCFTALIDIQPHDLNLAEILLGCMSTVSGKLGFGDFAYLLRDVSHEESTSFNTLPYLDKMFQRTWSEDLYGIIDYVATSIPCENATRDEVQYVMREGIQKIILPVLMQQLNATYSRSAKAMLTNLRSSLVARMNYSKGIAFWLRTGLNAYKRSERFNGTRKLVTQSAGNYAVIDCVREFL